MYAFDYYEIERGFHRRATAWCECVLNRLFSGRSYCVWMFTISSISMCTREARTDGAREHSMAHQYNRMHTCSLAFCYYSHYLIACAVSFAPLPSHSVDSICVSFVICAQLFESVIHNGSVNVTLFRIHIYIDGVTLLNTQLHYWIHDNNNIIAAVSFGSQRFCLCMSSLQFRFTFTHDHMLFACRNFAMKWFL